MKPVTSIIKSAVRNISHITGRSRVIQRLPRSSSRYSFPDLAIEKNSELTKASSTILSELQRVEFLEIPVNCLNLSEQIDIEESLICEALEDDLWEKLTDDHPKKKQLNSLKIGQKYFGDSLEDHPNAKEFAELQKRLAEELMGAKAELKERLSVKVLEEKTAAELSRIIAKKVRRSLLGDRRVLAQLDEAKERLSFRINVGSNSFRYKFDEKGNLEPYREEEFFTEIIDEGKSGGYSR